MMANRFMYDGEWNSFKQTYHRRLCTILIDTSRSTFRFEQVGVDLNFYTKSFLVPHTISLDPPEKVNTLFADTVDAIEEDLEKYFSEKRLTAETAKKKQEALDKLTAEDKKLLGIHEFTDVNIKKPVKEELPQKNKGLGWPYLVYANNDDSLSERLYYVARWVGTVEDGYEESWNARINMWDDLPSELLNLDKAEGLKQVLTLKMSEEAEVQRQKHPEGAYLVDRADGVPGHYAVGRWVKGTWKYQGHQEVWNIKNNGWASACSQVLSLEAATALMNGLNYEYNARYLIGLPKKD